MMIQNQRIRLDKLIIPCFIPGIGIIIFAVPIKCKNLITAYIRKYLRYSNSHIKRIYAYGYNNMNAKAILAIQQ